MTTIKEALIGLNDAIDLYWNEGRTDGQVKNICFWQFKAKEALANDQDERSWPCIHGFAKGRCPECIPCNWCGSYEPCLPRPDCGHPKAT